MSSPGATLPLWCPFSVRYSALGQDCSSAASVRLTLGFSAAVTWTLCLEAAINWGCES